jgi:hypothetical protein
MNPGVWRPEMWALVYSKDVASGLLWSWKCYFSKDTTKCYEYCPVIGSCQTKISQMDCNVSKSMYFFPLFTFISCPCTVNKFFLKVGTVYEPNDDRSLLQNKCQILLHEHLDILKLFFTVYNSGGGPRLDRRSNVIMFWRLLHILCRLTNVPGQCCQLAKIQERFIILYNL